MIEQRTPYTFGTVIERDYATAVQDVKAALAAEGFGILCEIDVAATMQKKLGVEFRPYVILGACNPPLAHQALTAEPDVGALLPCNVIVYSDDTPGRSVVAAMDPVAAFELTGNASIGPLAADVKTRLTRALRSLGATASSGGTAP